MDLIFLALYLSMGYLGGLALLSQAGLSLLHRGKSQQAAACFRAGSRLFPGRRNRALMCSNLMAALTILGDHEAVNREWKRFAPRLADAGPYIPLAVACYAASLYYQGRYGEALALTAEAGARPSGDERSAYMAQDGEALRLLNRSSCQLALGLVQQAEGSLQKACRLRVRHPAMIAHLTLGEARVAFRLGDLPRAAERVRSITIQRLPEVYLEELQLVRAYLLARCGHCEEAEALLDFPISIPSPRGYSYRPLAEAALAEARGQWDTAVHHYRRALQSGQPVGEAGLRAGRIREKQGRREEACRFYRLAMRNDPESCWATLARKGLGRLEAPVEASP